MGMNILTFIIFVQMVMVIKHMISFLNTQYGQYGTIMSYAGYYSSIPRFSSNQIVPLTNVCKNYENYNYGYCNTLNSYQVENIQLGPDDANSSNALQYTIKDASKYRCNESSGSC